MTEQPNSQSMKPPFANLGEGERIPPNCYWADNPSSLRPHNLIKGNCTSISNRSYANKLLIIKELYCNFINIYGIKTSTFCFNVLFKMRMSRNIGRQFFA
jgi:hypothetical protein